MSTSQKMKIIVISDGTGETATGLSRAIMTQFKDREVYFTRYKNVRTKALTLRRFKFLDFVVRIYFI